MKTKEKKNLSKWWHGFCNCLISIPLRKVCVMASIHFQNLWECLHYTWKNISHETVKRLVSWILKWLQFKIFTCTLLWHHVQHNSVLNFTIFCSLLLIYTFDQTIFYDSVQVITMALINLKKKKCCGLS